jgi:recombination protein RecR
MSYYPASIQNLIKNIAKLPAIGEKTAERLALHILRGSRQDAEQLANSILNIKDKVRFCSRCFALSDDELCGLCGDPARDPSYLCVVEQPADMVAVEKSGAFRGLYHILSGTLSPMNGIGPEDIRIARIDKDQVTEIVLATSTNVEGEATASYIAQVLEKYQVKVTRIASGVPMGGDLKYVDQVTLKRALETRHAI